MDHSAIEFAFNYSNVKYIAPKALEKIGSESQFVKKGMNKNRKEF